MKDINTVVLELICVLENCERDNRLLPKPVASPMGDGSSRLRQGFGAQASRPLILSLSKGPRARLPNGARPEPVEGCEFQKRSIVVQDSSGPQILFLGGLSQEKGTLVIFKAFEKVIHKAPFAKLLVAGYFDLDLNKTSYLKKLFPAYKFKLEVACVLEKIRDSMYN